MVKITIRDKDDRIVKTIDKNCSACCINANSEITVLGSDDIFHTIGYIDTANTTIILNDGSQYRDHSISVEK